MDVLKHPWFSKLKNNPENSTDKLQTSSQSKQPSELDHLKRKAVVQFFEKRGFNKEFVLQSMNKNLFNHIKACYESLIKLLNLQSF